MSSLAKPTRAERKRIKIDTSDLALPKLDPARDKAYLAFVRSQPCSIRGRAEHRCRGPVQAAHINVTGLRIKASDFATIPLCEKGHIWTQHQYGWREFNLLFDLNPWHVAFHLLEKWHRMASK